jgi:sigma-B regulation protein RsbU (phosphoserine phosphatase)
LDAAQQSLADEALRQIESLQGEVISLQSEVAMLRRRDDLLKVYMQRLDEELRLASRLQRDFLPKSLPEVGRVRFHTLFRPASYVSGDLYDVMRLDETHVGFYVADAVGHGMPAALLTMFMKRALETKEIRRDGYRLLNPSETMSKLNDALVDQNLSQATFATALYGTINTETMEMSFARGGHPNPVMLSKEGTLTTLDADGGLLGIFAGDTYTDGHAQLGKGDRLFIFTDGIEVAFSDDHTINTTKWRDELFKRRHLSTPKLLEDLSTHIDREVGSLDPKDDLTIIVAEAI